MFLASTSANLIAQAAPTGFVAVDTSALLGSPDPLDGLALELAFPKLRFPLPIQIASAPEPRDRL